MIDSRCDALNAGTAVELEQIHKCRPMTQGQISSELDPMDKYWVLKLKTR